MPRLAIHAEPNTIFAEIVHKKVPGKEINSISLTMVTIMNKKTEGH